MKQINNYQNYRDQLIDYIEPDIFVTIVFNRSFKGNDCYSLQRNTEIILNEYSNLFRIKSKSVPHDNPLAGIGTTEKSTDYDGQQDHIHLLLSIDPTLIRRGKEESATEDALRKVLTKSKFRNLIESFQIDEITHDGKIWTYFDKTIHCRDGWLNTEKLFLYGDRVKKFNSQIYLN